MRKKRHTRCVLITFRVRRPCRVRGSKATLHDKKQPSNLSASTRCPPSPPQTMAQWTQFVHTADKVCLTVSSPSTSLAQHLLDSSTPTPVAQILPPAPRRTRNVYGPILQRERAAATLCRSWRCARARQVAQRKRWSNALAARVNPLVRGFLARRATKKMFEEHYRRNRALLLVSDEREGRRAGSRRPREQAIANRHRGSLVSDMNRFDIDKTSTDPPACFRHQHSEAYFFLPCASLSRV